MNELSLKELKNVEFNILKHFAQFCKDNNITFFLTYGTLLGAIRYKGFIPWDDDVDVLVPRKDYEKLVKIYRDSENYCLYSIERNKQFGFPFAKMCDLRTRKVEFNSNSGVYQGVDIDIFPLDYWKNDLEKAKREARRIKKNIGCLNYSKANELCTDSNSSALKKIAMHICKILGPQFFVKKICRAACNMKNKTDYMGAKSWCVYGERDICSSKSFSESIDVEFEGMKFPAPIGYDEFLTRHYGDYLPEPPKEKQKTHHTFKAYRLTEEEIQEIF